MNYLRATSIFCSSAAISIILIKSSTVHTTPKTAKKLLEIIDNGNLKLLNRGYPTYQSNQRKSRSMFVFHFCSLSVFSTFCRPFTKFKKHSKVSYTNSCSYLTKRPNKDNRDKKTKRIMMHLKVQGMAVSID